MMVDLKKLINSPAFTGGRVIRYTGMHCVETEDLSQHSYETALLCLMIFNDLKDKHNIVLDKGILLEKAILHDIEESVMGDIPRTVKYHDERLKPILDSTATAYMSSICDSIGVNLQSAWENCKDDTYEGRVLSYVDLLLVARKAIRELDLKGNKEFYVVVKEVSDYLGEYQIKLEALASSSDDSTQFAFFEYLMGSVASTKSYCNIITRKHKDLVEEDHIFARKIN